MTAKQVVSMGMKPSIGLYWAVWEERLSSQRQMLTGMIPIDNLKAIGKMGIDQVPNPSSTISGDARVDGLVKARPLSEGEQGWPKGRDIAQHRAVVRGSGMNNGHLVHRGW